MKQIKKEKVLKVILNNPKKIKMKVKEVLKGGRYILIDGTVVSKDEILELVKE